MLFAFDVVLLKAVLQFLRVLSLRLVENTVIVSLLHNNHNVPLSYSHYYFSVWCQKGFSELKVEK